MEEDQEEEETVEVREEEPEERRKVSFPTRRERKRLGKSGRRLLGLAVVLIVLAASGWFIFVRQKPEKTPETILESQPEEATPTPVAEPVERGGVKIEVLNGTGIAKEAAFLQEKLGELGYTQFEVGDAEEVNYVDTEVTFSSGVTDEVRDEILGQLNDIYQEVVSETSDTLDVDVRVITGYRKGHTPTPTPTTAPTSPPTPTATVSATPTSSPTPTP